MLNWLTRLLGSGRESADAPPSQEPDTILAAALAPIPRRKITAHFSFAELIHSSYAARYGIPNDPSGDSGVMRNLEILAGGLERVRAALGHHPVTVYSGYRSPIVNRAVGGSSYSQHTRGLAADIVVLRVGDPTNLALSIRDAAAKIAFDQLILEYPQSAGGWVHVSFPEPGLSARGSVLTKVSRGAGYLQGIRAV